MQPPIHTSAPGKLFLIGEYAVLDGAPAVLTAVDRRVHVGVMAARDANWRVSAPNLGLEDIVLEADGRLPSTLNDDHSARLNVFDAVRAVVAERLDAPTGPLAITIDSSDFLGDCAKLGLGSSAAVAAALTRALTLAADADLSDAQLAELAVAGHRRAQHGIGSGGDVAACVYGGIIRYVQGEAPTPLTWPATLAAMVVVTGHGARTRDLVARVEAYRQRDPYGYDEDIARLSMLADAAPESLAHTGRFLPTAREYFEALISLDHHAHAGIVTDRHHVLHALAARHQGVFKSCGAGGGDVGLAFVRAGANAAALHSAIEHAGAQVLPLAFAAPGVRIENG